MYQPHNDRLSQEQGGRRVLATDDAQRARAVAVAATTVVVAVSDASSDSMAFSTGLERCACGKPSNAIIR